MKIKDTPAWWYEEPEPDSPVEDDHFGWFQRRDWWEDAISDVRSYHDECEGMSNEEVYAGFREECEEAQERIARDFEEEYKIKHGGEL